METDCMKKLLMRLANTIVANLDNTEMPGLFNGKMGLCLFLYEYSRFSGNETYGDIASDLLDDVIHHTGKRLSPNIDDGVAGIGCGLALMVNKSFVESDDNDLFSDIDETLLSKPRDLMYSERRRMSPVFSSGVYLSYRLKNTPDDIDRQMIEKIVACVEDYFEKISEYNIVEYLSFINSLLFICRTISENSDFDKSRLQEIEKKITSLINISLNNKKYRNEDLYVLKNIKPEILIPSEAFYKKENVKNDCGIWYDSCWWNVLYGSYTKIPPEEILQPFLDERMMNSFYDIKTVNSKLAGAGLNIIRFMH